MDGLRIPIPQKDEIVPRAWAFALFWIFFVGFGLVAVISSVDRDNHPFHLISTIGVVGSFVGLFSYMIMGWLRHQHFYVPKGGSFFLVGEDGNLSVAKSGHYWFSMRRRLLGFWDGAHLSWSSPRDALYPERGRVITDFCVYFSAEARTNRSACQDVAKEFLDWWQRVPDDGKIREFLDTRSEDVSQNLGSAFYVYPFVHVIG